MMNKQIEGIWTHFGYADEFGGDEYEIERAAWISCLDEILSLGYTFKFIHAQNSEFRKRRWLA